MHIRGGFPGPKVVREADALSRVRLAGSLLSHFPAVMRIDVWRLVCFKGNVV